VGLKSPVASADGRHWGVLCQLQGDRFAALVDGIQGLATRPVDNAADLVLSPDGSSWTFRAWPVKGSDQQIRITDDRESGPYRWAGNPTYSSNGKHGFYWAQTLDGKNQLVFDRQIYGPYAKEEDRHLYDLENGRFVFGMQEKAGVMAVTEAGTFGPYRQVEPLPAGRRLRDSNTGGLFGFVGSLNDGRSEVRVAAGWAGGGKTYGPFRRVDQEPAFASADGREWILPFEKDGGQGRWYLRNGVEVATDGFDVRPLDGGWLMMVRQGNQESFVKNGTVLSSWSHVFQWSVARDGKTWVAEVQAGDGPEARSVTLVNGEAQPGNSLQIRSGPEADRFTWFRLTETGEGQVHTLTVPAPRR
jgi:hypothetical protein